MDSQEMRRRMTEGKTYVASYLPKNPNKRFVEKFNRAPTRMRTKRTEYLRKAFGSLGKNAYLEPPFYCDHGYNIHIGDNFYANTDLIILDQCPVTIGDNVFLGPRIGIYCAMHPIAASVRNLQLEWGKPVTIGNNVWIGGDVTICPGVKIGNNVVIGAGAVVAKDIPDNCVAVGSPCKKIRDITEEDEKYWKEQLELFRSETGIKLDKPAFCFDDNNN